MELNTYQNIVNTTLRWLDLNKVMKVSVIIRTDIDRGRGYFIEKEIQLPSWLETSDPGYRLYYVLHELSHCLLGYKHDKTFKKIEDVILDLWSISIERKKVYPKRLFWHGKEILNIPAQQHTIEKLKEESVHEENVTN